MRILRGVVNELENDRFEVEMIDRRGLELTSELDVVLLVRLLENEFLKISLGGCVLSLDLVVHLLETHDH